MATMLEGELGGKKKSKKGFEEAVGAVLTKVSKEVQPIIFNGDGYSEAWHEEAEKRGLLNLKTTPDALATFVSEKNVALFEKYKVLSERELESRHEVMMEQYFTAINIEAETLEMLARTMVLPAAVRYLNELLAALDEAGDIKLTGIKKTAEKVAGLINDLCEGIDHLNEQNQDAKDTLEANVDHMK